MNKYHPDKVADRIAGAIVDYAYSVEEDPKVAVEVLIGHGNCHIIAESSVAIPEAVAQAIVERIAGKQWLDLDVVPQDGHLAKNQEKGPRCGDNGIFIGLPRTVEEERLSKAVRLLSKAFPTDGKYVLDAGRLVACQSNASEKEIGAAIRGTRLFPHLGTYEVIINPIGPWTGGTGVDAGATNRKLGSDMGRSATGGGLHGKDLSKADVSVNIHAYLKAQREGKPIHLSCAIGDDKVDGIPYKEIVEEARAYIKSVGGFEKFAEWGLA